MSVRGAAPSPALSWVREQGAESCITAIELATRVEALLGRLIFVSASEAELVVEGYVRPSEPAGFIARLVVSDGSGKVLGSRELATPQPDCRTLDEALALVIAVTLYPKSGLAGSSMLPPEASSLLDELFASEPTEPDPTLLDLKIRSKDSSESTQSEEKRSLANSNKRTEILQNEPSSPQEKLDSENPEELPETDYRVAIGASGAAGLGLLPSVSFGMSAFFRLMLREFWPMEISGIFWLPSQDSLTETEGASRRLELVHAGPSICPLTWRWHMFSSIGCVGVQFGAISARTKGLFSDDSTTKPLINLDLSASFEVEVLRHLSPRLAFRAAFPTIQHNFDFRDNNGVSRELFYMSQIGINAELGLNLKF